MKKTLISVIVPVYNTERFLERCLDSLEHQTYPNLEIILIDDGSTDGSADICDAYCEKDHRFTVYHRANKGAAAARNYGIKKASGDLIGFVDSDDYVSRDFYGFLFQLLEDYSCDIAECSFKRIGEFEGRKKKTDKEKISVLEGRKILADYLKTGEFSMCNKLYKRELVTSSDFTEGMINEDIAGVFRFLSRAKRLVHSDKEKYYYCMDHGSVTMRKFGRKDLCLLKAGKELVREAEKNDDGEIRRLAVLLAKRFRFTLLVRLAYFGSDELTERKKRIVIEKLQDKLRKDLWLLLFSSMPLSRKVVLVIICVHYEMLEIIIRYVRIVKKNSCCI